MVFQPDVSMKLYWESVALRPILHFGWRVTLARPRNSGWGYKWTMMRRKDMTDDLELIRTYEPVLLFSKDGKDNPENFFPLAAEHVARVPPVLQG